MRTRKQSSDLLPTYLVHAVGTEKINQLLHNPLDTTAPGFFIEDMLYLLDRSETNKLIRFVRDVDSARILRLTYNIKRMGCNKAHPPLDLLLPPSYSRCTLDIFNHLEILVSMVNGTNDVGQLIEIVNQNSLGPAVSTQDAYLEKLAYLIVYIGGVEKIFQLLNGIHDTRDIIFFIDRLDPDLNTPGTVPVSFQQIDDGIRLGNMDSVLRILVKLTDGNKIFELINGVRPIDENDDDRQRAYLINLTTVMQNTEPEVNRDCPNDTAITTLAAMINNLSNALSLVNLIEELNPGNVAALVNSVAKTSQHTNALPDDTLNPPANGSQACLLRDDLEAGGKKLAKIMNQVTRTYDLVYIINQLGGQQSSGVQTLADLIGRLDVDKSENLGALLNNVTPFTPAVDRYKYVPTLHSRHTSTGIGKVVNLLKGLDSGGSLVKLLNNIDEKNKLPRLLNETTNSSNLVGFLNAILRTQPASFNDLVDFLNIINEEKGIPRLIQLIQGLAPAIETETVIEPSSVHLTIAAIMAPQTGIVATDAIGNAGIGTAAMATLLNDLSACDEPVPCSESPAVGRLIDILNGSSADMAYNSATANISRREALVRIITFGVRYNPEGFNYQFPAIGPRHLATIINRSENASHLNTLMNLTTPYRNITDLVIGIACGDGLIVYPHTEDPATGVESHFIAHSPTAEINFKTHCDANNIAWGGGW
ncbi:hypothetical protein [Turneriella parva]|uniref:hypothetical protein n=1 Tax=Turneriella parva TaxID=29510 RepID=UPI0012F67B32|nr:hypothetical protein [Turneriella parva]